MISIISLALLILLILHPVSCRFYRNISLQPELKQVAQPDPIPISTDETFDEYNDSPLNVGPKHFMFIRPDYTFRTMSSLFRNLFEKRVQSASERRQRAGTTFISHFN
jgi:hypothetical protein